MSKLAKPFPIRQFDDGGWEVETSTGKWVKCETKEDAEILSNAPVVQATSYKTKFPDKVLATKLDKTAEILDKYKMGTTARFFQKRAELASGN